MYLTSIQGRTAQRFPHRTLILLAAVLGAALMGLHP